MLGLAEQYVTERVKRGELGRLGGRNHRSVLRNFCGWWGSRPVERLGRRSVEKWIETLDGLAPATRRDRFTIVRGFCRWLVRLGHVKRDPFDGVKAPRQPRSVPRALPLAAVVATLDACPDARARLIVTLMVQQGLRCCEVAGLSVEDLDLVNGLMRVVGKGGHTRLLPITDETRESIGHYLVEHPAPAGPLVRSYRDLGQPLAPESVSVMVVGWMKDAGVKARKFDGVSAHALRHTAATDMLRAGASPRDVQAALGHAHLTTTEVYMPYVVGTLEKAMGGRRYGLPAVQALSARPSLSSR